MRCASWRIVVHVGGGSSSSRRSNRAIASLGDSHSSAVVSPSSCFGVLPCRHPRQEEPRVVAARFRSPASPSARTACRSSTVMLDVRLFLQLAHRRRAIRRFVGIAEIAETSPAGSGSPAGGRSPSSTRPPGNTIRAGHERDLVVAAHHQDLERIASCRSTIDGCGGPTRQCVGGTIGNHL